MANSFILRADLLKAFSSAAGAHFNSSLEVCSINNKLSHSLQHWAVLHLDASLAKVMSWAHKVHGSLKPNVGRKVFKLQDGLWYRELRMFLIQKGDLHVLMNQESGFPRLLGFQKWLDFITLDVNSCSNMALQPRSSANLAKWTQMVASCSNQQKPSGKTSSHSSHNYNTPSFASFVLTSFSYSKLFQSTVNCSCRCNSSVFTFPQSLIPRPHSLLKLVSQSLHQNRWSRSEVTVCLVFNKNLGQ